MRERQSRIAKVKQALDQLANPFDHMSLDEKKDMALFLYYRRLQVNNNTNTRKFWHFHSVSECLRFVRMCNVCVFVFTRV